MPRSQGRATELISVERETRTADGGGGFTATWAEIAQAWAEVTWMRGGENETRGAIRETITYRFTIPLAAAEEMGLTTSDRIVWGGETYNIRERPRRQPRRPLIDIIAETGVAT